MAIRSSKPVQDAGVCGKNELLLKETVWEHAADFPVTALHFFQVSRHFSQGQECILQSPLKVGEAMRLSSSQRNLSRRAGAVFFRDNWYMPFTAFPMPLWGRRNNFLSILRSSFGWANKLIGDRLRRKKDTNLLCLHIQGYQKTMGAEDTLSS